MSLPIAELSARQSSAFERCAATAAARHLVILGRGTAKVEPFVGCPVWLVSSSRPGHASHLVWLFRGHLLCSCEAGQQPHIVTCSHAALVRLQLATAAAVPASVPVAAAGVPAASASTPVEEAGGTSAGPAPAAPTAASVTHCSRCGLPADPDQLAELGGECLDCLLDMRPHDVHDAQGSETRTTAARIIATERARHARYRREGRTSATDIRRDPSWQPEQATEAQQPTEPEQATEAQQPTEAQQAHAQQQAAPHPGDTAPLAPRPAFSLFKAG